MNHRLPALTPSGIFRRSGLLNLSSRGMGWWPLLVLICAGLNTTTVSCEAQESHSPWLDVDFSQPFAQYKNSNPDSNVHGVIPKPLRDDSAWADLRIEYSQDSEHTFDGRPSLKMQVSDVRKGHVQLEAGDVPLDTKTFTKVSFALEAPSAMKAKLLLRQATHPWKPYWSTTVDVTPEWKQFEFLIPPVADDPKAEMVLTTTSEGSLYIGRFTITFLKEDDVVTQHSQLRGNLLPASSLPIGPSGQWCLTHEGLGLAKTITSEETLGPTGVSALEIGIGGHQEPYVNMNSCLRSPPFILRGGNNHTISLYAKGSISGQSIKVSVGDPAIPSTVVSMNFSLSTDWQRYSFSAKIPYALSSYYVLSIRASQKCWIDGFSVEEGDQAGPFARTSPVELSLKSSSSYGLCFENKPFDYEIMGIGDAQEGMRLVGSLTDPRGKKSALKAVTVGDHLPMKWHGSIPAHVTPLLGPYLLEVSIEDFQGKPLAKPREILFSKIRYPHMVGKDAPKSPFGIHINPTEEQAAMVKNLGFNWIRLHDGGEQVTGWYYLEKEPDQFDFSYADQSVEILRDQHLMVLGMLNTAPRFYSTCPDDFPADAPHAKYFMVKADSLDKWSNYCSKVVSRYQGKIDYWEVINEPYAGSTFFTKTATRNASGGYSRLPGDPNDFITILKSAYQAVKSSNPASRILWMMYRESGWNDLCLQAGVADSFDIASFHYYVSDPLAGYPNDSLARIFRTRLNVDLADLPEKPPIWNTEGSTANLQVPWTNNVAYNQSACDNMSDNIIRCYLSNLSLGVQKWFMYTSHAWGVWSPSFYTFMAPDGTLAPSASAVSAFTWLLEGTHFTESLPIKDRNAFIFLFEGDTATIGVVVSNDGPVGLPQAIPDGWKFLDIYGNEATAADHASSPATVAYLIGPALPQKMASLQLETVRLGSAR